MASDALKSALASEFDAGFPHLARIPATHVVQFLDYVGDLDAKHRVLLRDELLAQAAAYAGGTSQPAPAPAIDRLRAAMRGPGEFVGGWRYTDVRFLAMVPKVAQFGGMANWLAMFGARAQEPRADLMPDRTSFVPAKAPLLRKLVKEAFKGGGFDASAFAGGLRFLDGDTLVDLDFGSRMGQIRWSVATGATRATHALVELRFMSYEGIWGLRGDWDMLTEENAARSIALLPGLVGETVRLRAL